ncbi:LYR motif-containing 4 isoform 2 [Schistosoma japonicum]|uniref:LYR motif-containing 4 isoform 2 n=2 Tax=Schistosoma japonicum TaxID=6182 RepID=A0A4Z2DX29_SCHJA|nr:LYR motif-containing 4 isoform 2 [Schistosoma japonicum]
MAFESRLQHLFFNLTKEAKAFTDYNIRSYFLRKIDKTYNHLSKVKDPNILELELKKNEDLLEVLKRQSALNNMYPVRKSVLEKKLSFVSIQYLATYRKNMVSHLFQ